MRTAARIAVDCQRIAGYFAARRRRTAAIPPARATPGRTNRDRRRTALCWFSFMNTGVCFTSLGRIEIWSSSSASQLTVLRKKSRLPWMFRNWFAAMFDVPYKTMRALSTVATAATASGPLISWGSGFATPRSRSALLVSPQLSGLVRASIWTLTPLDGVLSAAIDRVSGKSVVTPPMSRVIGWDSYCWMIGTSGPMPKSRPIGFRSEEHTSELQSLRHLVCRLLLEQKKKPESLHHVTATETQLSNITV